ncbi:DUF882 domain-containing protein [Pseudomonas taiwanensis]|uniref:YcbK family protein n=1 Tax=Pseudomonas taiwanensis TaxID=470150 RepID=UPI0028DE7380|nr:DUF882 domain-containing protein [Pseudomonas taiwanensis]MDT8925399.1 DUF882 domain-containing protein [Pseudomonas taiwanensis]
MILDPIGASRRQFLKGLAAAPVVLSAVANAADPHQDWRKALLQQDRHLELYRPASKERTKFCYWRLGRGYDKAEYLKGAWLLRDVEYNKEHYIDPQLLDTLFVIQEWLRREGRKPDIHILSGYRTPAHNFRLEGAARQSLHMKGQAADIHVPGVSTKLLAAMSMVISAGGVGIYMDKGFIHVDTGRVRTWRG